MTATTIIIHCGTPDIHIHQHTTRRERQVVQHTITISYQRQRQETSEVTQSTSKAVFIKFEKPIFPQNSCVV